MVDVIHVHEDDWGMRNLYPLIARTEVEGDIRDAAEAAERNRDPSGFGWTNVYVTKPPSQNYADVGLKLTEAESVLSPILPRVRRFNATISSAIGSAERDPYGSYDDDAWSFGLGAHCYLKLDAKGELVSNIWFDVNTDDPDAVARLRKAIEAIDKCVSSVIADYYLDFSGAVSQPGVLDNYFATIREQRQRAEQAMLEYRAKHEKPGLQGIIGKICSLFKR